MISVYVAGRDPDRARLVMDLLVQDGHCIQFDWTRDLESEQSPMKPWFELAAIQSADVFILLREPGQESALYEAGMAMALDKPVVVVGEKHEWFFSLPNVYLVGSDDAALQFVKGWAESERHSRSAA